MKYSQLKHLERMIAPNAQAAFDPFGLRSPGTFADLRIVESPDIPRYALPSEVMPGVPWPPGFRDEINRWSRAFIGTTNAVPRGQAYVLAGHTVVMRPEDVVRIHNIC